jgi:hypothetical protein
MSGFSAQWLAMREPYDVKARSKSVLEAVAVHFRKSTSITVVDLACGTGATLRGIGPRLPARQSWKLVDNDLSLLAKVATLFRPPELIVNAQPVDLVRDLEAALDGPVDLVTTSALLDLVSAEWIERLVVETAVRRLPLYAALSYDGRIKFTPQDPFDADIIDAVNRHQHGDKGFGPALGPDAAAECIEKFERVGYRVTQAASDWIFGRDDRVIQAEVFSGWAGAARELRDLSEDRIASWLARRREFLTLGRSSVVVGHVDFFAAPTTPR